MLTALLPFCTSMNKDEFMTALSELNDNILGKVDKKLESLKRGLSDDQETCADQIVNPRSLLEKNSYTKPWGGGVNRTPPSTFDTIHPIDLKFGTYNKLQLYFQLSKTTWCVIGFHGNNSQISDVTGGRHLGFSNFQILFKF